MYKSLRYFIILILFAALLSGCGELYDYLSSEEPDSVTPSSSQYISEDGEYTYYADVAEYLHTYEHLPKNYITKDEALDAGWVSDEGNLWDVTERKCIGGDRFGNREGRLPDAPGRIWYECDVNYSGGFRGGDRVVYSNDGLIYYTADHYNTFTQLY